jgi:plasmid stabilization system protein ParE
MVKWSIPARNDLRQIYEYIAQDSSIYAKNAVRNIVEKSMNLEAFPRMGRIVPEISDQDIREIFIYSYRLIYKISSDDIEILTIIHGKRDFQPDNL